MSEHGPHVESWLGLQYRSGCSQDCCVDLEEWKDRGGSPGSKGRGKEGGRGREEMEREENRQPAASLLQ